MASSDCFSKAKIWIFFLNIFKNLNRRIYLEKPSLCLVPIFNASLRQFHFILLISLTGEPRLHKAFWFLLGFLATLQFLYIFLYCVIFWLNKNELNWTELNALLNLGNAKLQTHLHVEASDKDVKGSLYTCHEGEGGETAFIKLISFF